MIVMTEERVKEIGKPHSRPAMRRDHRIKAYFEL